MRLFVLCMLLALVLLGTVSAQNASKPSLVARLKNNTVVTGCGCYFQLRGTPLQSERYVFLASIEEEGEKTAWMNIGGRDVKLTRTRNMDSKGRLRVGSRSTRRYIAGDISVDVTYIATRVCKRDDENCESTDYDATFVVKKGQRSQVVKAVGGCGC
jgi:hypothetical protein